MFMDDYPRYTTPASKQFDASEMLAATEGLVCGKFGDKKYTKCMLSRTRGTEATAIVVGCPLRCFYCSADWSRDFPEKFGQMYTPDNIFHLLWITAVEGGANVVRLSGGDAAIGRQHTLALLKKIEESTLMRVILHTTAIPFGADPHYAKEISKFKKAEFRVEVPAGEPRAFSHRTGAREDDIELQFDGIANLVASGAKVQIAAMTDKRAVKWTEREETIKRITAIEPKLVSTLVEENINMTETSTARLTYAGLLGKEKAAAQMPHAATRGAQASQHAHHARTGQHGAQVSQAHGQRRTAP